MLQGPAFIRGPFCIAWEGTYLPKRSHRQGLHPCRYIKKILEQPPQALYDGPALYWAGQELEIDHFIRLMDYGDGYLKLALKGKNLTVTGDDLSMTALEKGRVLLHGRFLKIEFSYD